MAVKGGVVSMSIKWNCDLDLDFMKNCLPKYRYSILVHLRLLCSNLDEEPFCTPFSFRILDNVGWNFRHAKFHEENRRTLYKMYGIKVRNSMCPPLARLVIMGRLSTLQVTTQCMLVFFNFANHFWNCP